MNIISFSGRIKSGKTASVDTICLLDSRFERVSFASIMKDMYAREMGINRVILDDVLEKEKHRRGMQEFGDKKRKADRYCFAVALINTLNPNGYYGIDDQRYLEEVEVLMKLGAVPYGVFAEPHHRAARGWVPNPDVDNHLSETELGDLNAETWRKLGGGMVYNNKTRDHLKDLLLPIVRQHFPYQVQDLAKLGKSR